MQLPVDDKHTYSRDYLESMIAVLMGGRVSEELTFDRMTTGAGNDIERVTELARKMVCEWGMSGAMGPLAFGKKEEQIFLGREISQHRDYSEATAVEIDREVKSIVLHGYNSAKTILEANRAALRNIAEALLEREVLDGEQIAALVRGESLPVPPQSPPTAGAEVTEQAETTRRPGVLPAPGNQPA
jgi:cell division protease FtsH